MGIGLKFTDFKFNNAGWVPHIITQKCSIWVDLFFIILCILQDCLLAIYRLIAFWRKKCVFEDYHVYFFPTFFSFPLYLWPGAITYNWLLCLSPALWWCLCLKYTQHHHYHNHIDGKLMWRPHKSQDNKKLRLWNMIYWSVPCFWETEEAVGWALKVVAYAIRLKEKGQAKATNIRRSFFGGRNKK